jgi:hypothetical protein
MAKSALNGHVNSAGTTYTVPVGKYAILSVVSMGGAINLLVNGVNTFTPTAGGQVFKPLVLAAGDVLSASGGGADFGYSGFLFDN